MPGFDGTGPLGQGPLTGQGQGFCVLTTSEENPNHIQGFAGIGSRPIGQMKMNEGFKFAGKEVINMPFGNGTGPVGLGPMTGRAVDFCAGYPVPGYMNPVGVRSAVPASGMFPVVPYAAGNYGYARFYTPGRWFGRGFGRLGFGRGFGRGRGRGRGRFGYWW